MDRLLVFVVLCILGSAYAGVVRRDAPNTEQIDGFQGLQVLASQLLAGLSSPNQPSPSTGSGSQSNVDPTIGGGIESIFRSWFSNNGQNMNYDLSEAMQMLNNSYGMPAYPRADTSRMTREQYLEHVQKQSKDFNNMINSKMTTLLEPNLVVKFLNLTMKASDPTITNNPDTLAALQTEYQNLMIDYQNKMQARLNGEKSSRPADAGTSTLSLESLQKQMSAMSSMYNRELSQAMKPDDIKGALSGSEQDMNGVAQNLGKAVMNIFKSISQGPGPANQPLNWD